MASQREVLENILSKKRTEKEEERRGERRRGGEEGERRKGQRDKKKWGEKRRKRKYEGEKVTNLEDCLHVIQKFEFVKNAVFVSPKHSFLTVSFLFCLFFKG